MVGERLPSVIVERVLFSQLRFGDQALDESGAVDSELVTDIRIYVDLHAAKDQASVGFVGNCV
jgi:hypothetical protein